MDWNFQSWQCEKRIPRRGLYSLVDWNDGSVWLIASAICRGLYSLVDWNITCCPPPLRFSCRGLYSLVDWNPCVSINTVNPCSSRLIQPRGLKWKNVKKVDALASRGLYSLVDWNIYVLPICVLRLRRGLYSLVDWNVSGNGVRYGDDIVEAYTASWIEIIHEFNNCDIAVSRLIQPRGLKFFRCKMMY